MQVWLSIDPWLVTAISIAYLAVLFLVAHWGQTASHSRWAAKPWVYSLALGVSCTSWAFYGIIGQASSNGQWLSPIYIGTIGFFVFGWPVLLKMLRITRQQNLSSIADFLASRYAGAPTIAAVVTLVSILGTLPYLALQLHAVSHSFDLLTGSYQSGSSTTFTVTLVLIGFSILFGARTANVNKHNPGLVLAIAFSSLVKLFAITVVGLFVCYGLFTGVTDLLAQAPPLPPPAAEQHSGYITAAQVLLGALTIFITPQLYHMIIQENSSERALRQARWQYPLYLVAINLFVLPIAIAGSLTFPGGSVNGDSFILTLPLYHQQALLSVLVYLGGLAAATAMVIVAAIVLSTMLTTELFVPILVRLHWLSDSTGQQRHEFSKGLLQLRRMAIAAILLLSFAVERLFDQQRHLANIGILAFVLLVQFAPAVLGALYWRGASSKAALAGLLTGSAVWAYCLLMPTVAANSAWLSTGPWGMSWLAPTHILPLTGLDPVSHGVLLSLLLNCTVFVLGSWYAPKQLGEKLQADVFLQKHKSWLHYPLTVQDLLSLLRRFIDRPAADALRAQCPGLPLTAAAPSELIEQTRQRLASVLGCASTRLVMSAASRVDETELTLTHVADIVDEANQLFEFNRELLQAAVENIEQGISVVDADMHLVAWNQRYIELLNYPKDYLRAGMPIAELLEYNVSRGLIEGGDLAELVARRVAHMQSGHSHYYQRILPTGRVLEIRGQAMPGGGFVSTFSDITQHIEAEQALQRANETLEQRVSQRTEQLTQAKAEAEAANRSKSRFLAAASHDLMQPFNALALFTDMLRQQTSVTHSPHQSLNPLVGQIQQSLSAVEALLADLVEISKLDGQAQPVAFSHFALREVLDPLAAEIALQAQQAKVQFRYQPCSGWVYSDKKLLRRVLQNFLSNALNYAKRSDGRAKVLLAVKRRRDHWQLSVFDNGPGIAPEQQQLIFNEFERLHHNADQPGLGLGLAIAKRIASLLGNDLQLHSTLGRGSCFALLAPRSPVAAHQAEQATHTAATGDRAPTTQAMSELGVTAASQLTAQDLSACSVLLIDNDPLLLNALAAQLRSWGCQVWSHSGRLTTAADQDNALLQPGFPSTAPQLIIADYHLDQTTGVALVQQRLSDWQDTAPKPQLSSSAGQQYVANRQYVANQQYVANSACAVIICSADHSEAVRGDCSAAGFSFIGKPVKALALKRLIKQLL